MTSLSGRCAWRIRRLTQSDLPDYRPLRLTALRDHPEAFGSSFEEEQCDTPETHMSRLIARPPGATLGAFVTERLVGTACVMVSPRIKQRHKGHVLAVYVAPEWRGTGLARGLLDDVIGHAREAGLLALTLSVTIGNEPARRLYLRAGFRTYGIEPRSLRIGGELHDEELMALALD
jgi:ribosomal protein S18 acetylase RimI-like enzyme